MDPLALKEIGRTGLHVTRLGFGGGTLGDRLSVVPEAQSDATVQGAWTAGIRYFDTAPFYGLGKSEHRVGRILRNCPREEIVVSTKVGRVLSPGVPASGGGIRWAGGLPFSLRFDYTRAGILRSYEDSLQRLGMDRVDALLIHDLDLRFNETEAGMEAHFRDLEGGGGFEALQELKRSGAIRAVGAGINHMGMIPRFLPRFDLDFFLVAMPYTLLDQAALREELPACQERGIGIVIGAPFASGILATGAAAGASYGYRPVEGGELEKAQRIEAVCTRHGVPLGAAALQFPLAHPCVAAVIPGPNAPEQVRRNLEWVRWPIPADLWAELKSEGLIAPEAPTPG
jgi:D-threo-aldose 1-dehydrogenase